MSKTVSTHFTRRSLVFFVEEVYGGDYADQCISAINRLWHKFNLSTQNPFMVCLSNVMCLVSRLEQEREDFNAYYEKIEEEVEDSFHQCDAIDYLDDEPDLPHWFYCFCTTLSDFLIEEEEIVELLDYNLEMITINNDRVDLTF